MKAFGRRFYIAAIWKFISDTAGFLQPVLLRELLLFVMSYKTSEPQPLYRGYTLATLMFLCSLTQTACTHIYFHLCFTTGMQFRAALTTAVYQKALRLSNSARQQFTVRGYPCPCVPGKCLGYLCLIVVIPSCSHVGW